MRMALAIIICKIANTLSKLLKKEGTVIGGYWALKIYPNVLNNIKYPKYVIGVTGSSGKGSTTELIAHILNKNNITYAYNKNGSNAINGITSLILSNTSLNGKYKKQALLMELDEKHMVHLLEHFTLTHLVITNITRDQPPRNAHPEYIQSLIKSILKEMNPETNDRLFLKLLEASPSKRKTVQIQFKDRFEVFLYSLLTLFSLGKLHKKLKKKKKSLKKRLRFLKACR